MIYCMNIIELTETDSTNNYAKRLLEESRPAEMTVVSSLYQSSGKGQSANKWVSERGKNLLFSIIFYPSFIAADRQFYLSKVVTLGICDFLELLIPGVKVKWPNDIYFNNKKIAGILIENAVSSDYMDYSIIGIGLNINQTIFPLDLPYASSLKNFTFIDYDLKDLLEPLTSSIERRYQQLRKHRYAKINEAFHSYLYKAGENVSFLTQEGPFSARICGVADTGELLLGNDQEIRSFQYGEIDLILE